MSIKNRKLRLPRKLSFKNPTKRKIETNVEKQLHKSFQNHNLIYKNYKQKNNYLTSYSNNKKPNKEVTMLSVGQVINVVQGQTVRLQCEFHMENFNMFLNPALWFKQQHSKQYSFNTGAIIHEPFESLNRYSIVRNNGDHDRYNFQLVIKSAFYLLIFHCFSSFLKFLFLFFSIF